MNAPFPLALVTTHLEIISTDDGLAAVKEQWTQLWQAGDSLIFQSHDWISTWWNAAGRQTGAALRIGLVWDGEILAAVVPLAITRRKGLRILEWAAAAHSDYGDLLRAPTCPPAALRDLWSMIWKAGGFDVAVIGRIAPGAEAGILFNIDAGLGFKHSLTRKAETSSRIGGDWQSGAAWLASHPKKTRQNYRRGVKLLEESGARRFRLIGPDEPLEPVLEKLAVFKRQWLEKNMRVSSLFDAGTPTLNALVQVFSRAGILRLFVIEVNGAIVAVSVNFVQRGAMMAWVTTYDPAFARSSPGMALIFDYVQWSFDNGLRQVDFLCGGEAFKGRLATHVVTLQSVMQTRNARGAVAAVWDRIRHQFRQMNEPKAVAAAGPDSTATEIEVSRSSA